MFVHFRCPKCKVVLKAPDSRRGEVIDCSGCAQRLRVPGTRAENPPEAEIDTREAVSEDPPKPEPEEEEQPRPRKKKKKKRSREARAGFWGTLGGHLAGWALTWVIGAVVSAMLSVLLCCGWVGWLMWHGPGDFDDGPLPDPVRVSAVELVKDYQTDPDLAFEKYEEEDVEVTGVVQQVVKNRNGETLLVLQGEAMPGGMAVRCHFGDPEEDEEAVKVLRLQQGQQATVRGYCEGKRGNSIRILDCELVKSPAPATAPAAPK
jgi:hypothetical protein